MSLVDFERTPLSLEPTPIERLERVGAELGITLHVKRDDLNGFGGGGNKVRKLEFLMPEALRIGADVLITPGGTQSNHARIVAALARKFGMSAKLLLRGSASAEPQGNLLLDRLFGADIEFVDPAVFADELDDRLAAAAAAQRAEGRVPYVIPLGAKGPRGALGYIRAAQEMATQFADAGLAPPDYVVVAAGTGSMMAALIVGCRQCWPGTTVVGVQVTGKGREPLRETIAGMATEAARFAGLPGSWTGEDVWVEEGYLGSAYGIPSAGCIDAIRLLAREEALLLDPVYTAKAMDGLVGMVRAGKIQSGRSAIFVHSGGLPALYPFAGDLA